MTTIYQILAEIEETGGRGILCTIVSAKGSTPRNEGSKMVVYPDGSFQGTIGGGELEYRVIREALEALTEGKPRKVVYSMADPQRGDPGVCGGQLEIFVEPILPRNKLVIVGLGHVGKEVAYLGHWLGFHVIVCDDRPDFCNPESIPEADEFYENNLHDLPEHIEITPWTYIVLTTRNVDVDTSILPVILETEPAYIGVIGSKRRWATTKSKLLDAGISPEKVEIIRSPIGLGLNAETPREIALSILAEIIMLKESGDGEPMSEKVVS